MAKKEKEPKVKAGEVTPQGFTVKSKVSKAGRRKMASAPRKAAGGRKYGLPKKR